ncbi:TetR/AcrR family transcriptional regulator [Spartinivicinus ruber]|uniref:TetR/AcrR family transcriptional regulator n=1 Tax=Spartinivicinus ruber TaxID=2683272 RepID=UPI0013D67B91|nr:TetR/AcrR family transcriptional regulator [Spartinivicinus ruber]
MSDTRQNIIEAGVRELSHDPNASMASIAMSAGVSRMTINRYFSNRQNLLACIEVYLLEKYEQMVDEAIKSHDLPADQLQYYLHESISFGNIFHIITHHSYLDTHHPHDPTQCRFANVNRKLTRIIEALNRSKQIRKGVPVLWVLQLLDSIIIATWESLNHGAITKKEAPKLAWDSFKNAVLKGVE